MKASEVVRKNACLSSSLLSELMNGNAVREITKKEMRRKDASADEILHCLTKMCQPIHEPIIQEAVVACELDIESKTSIDYGIIINALHYCAIYYDDLGNSDKALNVSLKNLAYSVKYGSEYSTRRAHSILSHAYARVCDFQNAFTHSHQAYRISVKQNDAVGQFMALTNTTCILDLMGLLRDAQKLYLRLALEQPFGSEKLDILHLVNSTNGMRISHVLGDVETAREFYKIALRSSNTQCKYITSINRAHFEAAQIVQLALQGELEVSAKLAIAALEKAKQTANVNVIALTLCAQAECHLKMADVKKVGESQLLLERFTQEFKGMVELYQDMLTILLKIDVFMRSTSETTSYESRSQHYEQLQKIYSLGIKHRNFFKHSIQENTEPNFKSLIFESPHYKVPSWVREIGLDPKRGSYFKRMRAIQLDSSESRIPHDLTELSREFRLKNGSSRFNAVENWVIVIDCVFGGDGYNCIRVGKLVAEIAGVMGYTNKSIQVLELACRLRDIGKIAFAFSAQGREKSKAHGRLSVAGMHTTFGANLLALSGDTTFDLAATIALSHHEWWNGCGYPIGISGTDIPIEARICAVADFIVSRVLPGDGEIPWLLPAAVRQAQTMAGMQFDPDVCYALNVLMKQRGNELSWGASFNSGIVKNVSL